VIVYPKSIYRQHYCRANSDNSKRPTKLGLPILVHFYQSNTQKKGS